MSVPSASKDNPIIEITGRTRWLWAGAWLAAFIPAFYILWVILENRPSVPYHDSWAFVWQYRDWTLGKVGWRQLFALHNDHPSAVGKTIYFVVMHFLQGQVGLLPLISWTLSLGISLGVVKLSRPLWQGKPLRGAGLVFMANFTIFTGAQGHTWIWDFVFQNFIPGCFLVWSAALLTTDKASWQRLTAAFMMSLISVNCFASGVFVGLLLIPLVWWHVRDCGLKKQVITSALWLGFLLVTAMIAFHKTADGKAAAGGSASGHVAHLMEIPWMAVQYFLSLIGLCFGQGTVMEPTALCAAAGAVLMAALIWCLRDLWKSRDMELWRNAAPWLAMCGFAMVNAALITLGRLRFTLETAIAPRYVTLVLFFPLGMLFLWVMLSRRNRRMARASTVLATAFLLMQGVGWFSGLQSLQTYHIRMDEEKYALCLAKVLPLPEELVWQLDGDHPTATLANFLAEGGRLRGVRFLESDNIAPIKSKGVLSSKFANFDLLSRQSDGALVADGRCGLGKDLEGVPDLILLTGQTEDGPERILAFTMPKLPDDFLERRLFRRIYADHYFGWSITLKPEMFASGKALTVRAYAFDGEKRRATPMDRSFTIPPRS